MMRSENTRRILSPGPLSGESRMPEHGESRPDQDYFLFPKSTKF
jgi:hypothetical protein